MAVPCSWEHKTRNVARPSATPAHVLLAGSRPPPAFSSVALWPAGSVLRNALPSFARVSHTATGKGFLGHKGFTPSASY